MDELVEAIVAADDVVDDIAAMEEGAEEAVGAADLQGAIAGGYEAALPAAPLGPEAQAAPPPPPIPGPDGPAAGDIPPWVTVYAGHGKLTWFQTGGKFEARWRHPGHGHCALTRTSKHVSRKVGPGRPCGSLLAWLEAPAESHMEHMALVPSLSGLQGLPTRRAARERLAAMPYGDALMAQERAPQSGETPEPEFIQFL